MISSRNIRMRLPVALLLFVISPACSNEEMSDVENRVQFPELIQIIDTESRDVKSETIQENRDNAITRVVRQSRDAIVMVTFDSPKLLPGENPKQGDSNPTKRSGFFVSSEGHIVTKYRYSIDSGTDISVQVFEGTSLPAQIVGSDPYSGITLLKVDTTEEHEFVGFGNSDSLMVGEWSIALGIPADESRIDFQPSVSAGVVNALDCKIEYPAFLETVYPDMIRTDAVITSSSEGGPMLNASGQVIGLNTYIPSGDGSDGSYGHGYAIPGNKVARVVNHLADGDNVTLNYSVGLEMVPVTKKVADRYNLSVHQGLLVLGVNRDGPAYEGGILPGDVIISIGTDHIYGDTHAWAVLRQFNNGDLMPVTFMRDEKELETQIKLRKRVKKVESQ